MATIITSECINCGACEPECPNTAIYQGGVEWEHNGQTHPAIATDIFYIVPDKCTECVGFYDQEACAAVCPVDCCVPDPNRPETEGALLQRAKELHPEATFGDDFPSRFRERAAVAAAPAAEGAGAPASAETPAGAPRGATDATVPIVPIEQWEVPLHCFRCDQAFTVPFAYLQAGTVFNCPHCQGTYVPTFPLCQAVERALRGFHDTFTSDAQAFHERRQRDLDRFREQQRQHLEAFGQRLTELARSVRPPGAPYTKKRSSFRTA
jgi:ferredoxin